MLNTCDVNLALLGHPVAHSQSPKLHNHWLSQSGLTGQYQALSFPNSEDFDLRAEMQRYDLTGVNITTPLKQAVFEQVDQLSEAARLAGAVNTVISRNGLLVGHNTDGAGFLLSLERQGWVPHRDIKVVVLGAGGAARGVASALSQAGVIDLVVLNRTERRAVDCVTALGCGVAGPLSQEAFCHLGHGADLVIHTTSGEGATEVAKWNLEGLKAGSMWVDINYWMDDLPQKAACLAAEVQFMDGLPMLICQAAISFELFTGFTPNPDPFLVHLR